MHLITRKALRIFWRKYPDSRTALERWSKIVEKNNFNSFAQLRATFPSADLVGKLTVFNIGGNKYRLIADIHFNRHKVYIRQTLTHTEYNRGNWKL
ncbi:MAG: type II toxin-antitoxin system HigB family toxin [Cyanobacteria bacterium J06643_13]